MRTIAIVNQKGGCGKTTTAINLAAVYARRGHRTLIVDMDPQGHCATGLGVPEGQIEYGVADALVADSESAIDRSSLVWEVSRNLHLAPSTMRLAGLEAPGGGLHARPDKDRRLAWLLGVLKDDFDCCLVDCPPTIGLLTFNALRAAREALIPVETGFFAMKGAARQWNTIQRTIRHIGRPIACHLLPTLHRPDEKIAEDILASLRRDFAGQIVPVVIGEHEVLRAATSYGQPVIEFAPESQARADFEALASWLDEHRSAPQLQIEVLAGEQPIEARAASTTPTAAMAGVADGSRAAELVRRVQDLTRREETPVATATTTPPPPTATSTVTRPAPVEVNAFPAPPLPTATTLPPRTMPASPPTPAPARPEDAPGFIGPRRPATPPAPLRPLVEEITSPPSAETPETSRVSHLYGVRPTSQGVLFVQPGDAGRALAIAGDFNRWSPTANPLRYNAQLHVYQAIVPVEPGRYQYRLVVDGRWQADPYNDQRVRNEYGEPNSVLTVHPRQGNP